MLHGEKVSCRFKMKRIQRILVFIFVLMMALISSAFFAAASEGETEKSVIYVKSIKLDNTKLSLPAYSLSSLTASVSPQNADNTDLLWSSSNTSVVSVDKYSGVIYCLNAGTAEVTAAAVDGSRKKAVCTVTVTPRVVKASSISLPANKALYVGDSTELSVTFNPGYTSNQNLTWTSSNKKVATVNAKGVVRALSAGTTRITAVTKDGTNKKAICNLRVVKPVSVC